MKKRAFYVGVCLVLLSFLFLTHPVRADTDAESLVTDGHTPGIITFDEPQRFSIEGENVLLGSGGKNQEMMPFGLRMDWVTVAAVERVETFLNTDSWPWITTSLKYIEDDGSNGDSRDVNGNIRWRYVYCIEHEKDSPLNQTMLWKGWANRYVNHIIYYGASYYYETSRDPSHSTGNWRYDYLATHMAITIATRQYTLEQVVSSIRHSPASAEDEERLIRAITNMINDAYASDGLAGWDSEGWFRMDTGYCSFSLEAASDSWIKGSDGNYYTDWITPLFTSHNGYYANADITSVTCSVPEGVTVEKKYSDSIHSPYRLAVSEYQYSIWERTGETITSTVTIQVPSHWGAATYTSGDSNLQNVCFISYSSINQYTTFSDNISFIIPKKEIEKFPYQLQITKKNTDEIPLAGAEFTLYSDQACENTVDQKITDEEGILLFSDLMPEETYYLKETMAPAGYLLPDTVIPISLQYDQEKEEYQFTIDDMKYSTQDNSTDSGVYITGSVSDYTVHMKVLNEPGIILPSTGSRMRILILVMGVFCMSSAFWKYKVKAQNRR